MNKLENSWYFRYLTCPDCNCALLADTNIRCSACPWFASFTRPIVLKPKNPGTCTLKFKRIPETSADEILGQTEITKPSIIYNGPSALRDSTELISEMMRYMENGGTVLDLGCGPRDQAVPVEHQGYQYVGMDYTNSKADFLADAHSIPFQDSCFDCVLSYAVLEHLHNPYVAINEINRILKPGGIYVGTVSQGEPFHDSYFHHTAWGLISLISSVPAFHIERLWASGDTLGSLSVMGRYPRVIKSLLNVIHKFHIHFPYLSPRKMKWPEKDRLRDELHRAGSICFVIKKTPG